jgi:hypothetical protein
MQSVFDKYQVHRRVFLALIIGIAAGFLCTWLMYKISYGAADFYPAIRIARDLWNRRNPYNYPVAPDLVSYPLPAGLVAAPFAILPNELAAGVFIGLSSALLAWCSLSGNRVWPLGVFLSWPFAYAISNAQWTPLIMCIWFIPSLMPLLLIKPQIVFPVLATSRISRRGIWLTVLILAISLAIYPSWPLAWLSQIRTYTGTPPLFSLPLGPVILLALFKYKDRRAWLLLLMGIMPQRVIYDQLPLLLISTNGIEMLIQVVCSWFSLPVLISAGGWNFMPINWQFWIVLTMYIPALVILFLPSIPKALSSIKNIVSKIKALLVKREIQV